MTEDDPDDWPLWLCVLVLVLLLLGIVARKRREDEEF